MDQLIAPHFTIADFGARAARQNGQPVSGEDYGDHRFNPELVEMFVRDGMTDAAVLIAVVERDGEATVLLTKRAEKMRTHSGQVAFPGGRIDPEDASAEAAAIREAEEEIGLGAEFIEIVGRLPDYLAGNGFRVAPILAVVRPGFMLTINEDEVDDVFEVPLAYLMDPANHLMDSRIWEERERFFYQIPALRHNVWGITAAIIRMLYERLYP